MNNLNTVEQLVPVFNTKIGDTITQACDARALHTYLQNGDKFADWIKGRIEKYQFQENQDFICVSVNSETQRKNGQRGISKRTEYHLTIGMAKELAMVENNAKGREVRRYFIRMEKLALETIATPPNAANVIVTARAWADMTQLQANMAKTQADVAKNQADLAQAQANQARAWADEYERRVATESKSSPSPQSPTKPQPALLPPREAAFLQAWWHCLGTQPVTSTDLYVTIATKQCQELNDSSGALLGDVSQWTPKKLSYALKRWSQLALDNFAVFSLGKTSRGNLWRLERKENKLSEL
jgi:phage anti-repressor protein